MVEKELKSLIDEKIFEKVKEYYKWDDVIVQENHYYADTRGVLGKERATFRIRAIGDTLRIQVKLHKNDSSALQISEELEYPVDSVPDNISAEEAKKYTGLDCGELVLLGSTVTERYVLKKDGTELCLDKNTYLDMTDYEIELEYTEMCSQELLDSLKTMGVEFNEKCTGKYSRFVNRFNSLLK